MFFLNLSKIVCISTNNISAFEKKFYLPVCNLLCFFKKYFVVKTFLQTSHSHCRLSCTLTCWFRWDSLLNTFSQFGVGHLNPWGVSKHSKLSETMGLISEHSRTLKWKLNTWNRYLSQIHISVTFPSHLKKLCSILRF